MDNFVTHEEQAQLERIVASENEAWVRRARIILLKVDDRTTSEISPEVGLSPRRVRYWVSEFKKRRMGIFPEEALALEAAPIAKPEEPTEPDSEQQADAQAEVPPQEEAEPEPVELPEITVSELCQKFKVDMDHARHVADLALTLFDRTSNVHSLPEGHRYLAAAAAILHNVGFVAYPEKHNIFGRDILLEHRLVDFDEGEVKILAFTTSLHRKKHKRKRARKEAKIVGLSDETLPHALGLAGIVRIADGLDYSQSQSTKISEIKHMDQEILVSLSGPFAFEDGMRAQSKADLWDSLYDVPIRFFVEGVQEIPAEVPEPTPVVTPPVKRRKTPGVMPEDWMSEAGRKVLAFHFYRMLDHEPGTVLGEDIEELHDMRVAVRRMRSAMRIFRPYFKKGVLTPYLNDLRRTGRVLGRVRDLDVFLQKAQKYIEEGSSSDPSAIDLIIENWQSQRAEARDGMLKYLDSKRYRNFVQSFGEFLETEGAGGIRPSSGKPTPLRVFQCAPAMIYARDQVVRSYDDVLEDAPLETLHSLRIDIKRFRYTLEFFREVLEEAELVIKTAVKLQDHLGDLNDADVACQLLIGFLDRWRSEDRRERINISGVTDYLVAKQVELLELVETFPKAWESYNSPEVRKHLALAIARL
ncbi:MAG: CHAD domain-containing protein [Anaerolineales bacterium]|nr:CHAD domain-containing protein [Anaerolineales bacterium]